MVHRVPNALERRAADQPGRQPDAAKVNPESRSRAAVMAKALAFGVVYVISIVLSHRYYFMSRIATRELSAAFAIAFVQCATIIIMLGFSFVFKLAQQLRTSRAARLQPDIREWLAFYAAGN